MLLEASRGSSCPPNLDVDIQADDISLGRLLEASVDLSKLVEEGWWAMTFRRLLQ